MVFRSILSFVLSYCLGMYPVHAKTIAQQEALRSFVKDSGIGQENMTIAQWIKKNRAYYHPKVAELASQWAAKNPNMKMPKVKMTSFNGENGQETTRLVFQEKKESTTVDIVTQGDKVTMSIDGKKYSYNDLYYDGALEAAASSPQVTWNELTRIHKLAPKKAAAYQVQLKKLVNSLTALQQGMPIEARKVSFIDLLLEQAHAIPNGTRCIMGGFATVQKNNSCGGGDARLTAGCATGQVNCNPVVYGYRNGKQICVEKKPATEVSPSCDAIYPIPEKKQELVDSVIANINSQKPEERDAAWANFFKNLESDIQAAGLICDGPDFNFEALKNVVRAEGSTKHFKPDNPKFLERFPKKLEGGKDINEHQRIACATVMNRLFYMDQAKTCVRGSLAEADAGAPQSKKDSPECSYVEAETIALPDTAAVTVEPLPEAKVVPVPPPAKAEKKDKKWLLWIIAGLGAACVFKIICGGKDKKPKPPVYPPIPVGKPGESETPRGGSGGVGGTITPAPTATTMPLAPARTGVQ